MEQVHLLSIILFNLYPASRHDQNRPHHQSRSKLHYTTFYQSIKSTLRLEVTQIGETFTFQTIQINSRQTDQEGYAKET